MLLRDFNETLSVDERQGLGDHYDLGPSEFRNVINSFDLTE